MYLFVSVFICYIPTHDDNENDARTKILLSYTSFLLYETKERHIFIILFKLIQIGVLFRQHIFRHSKYCIIFIFC